MAFNRRTPADRSKSISLARGKSISSTNASNLNTALPRGNQVPPSANNDIKGGPGVLPPIGFANPTAVAGPVAINGTATTAMRSDAAPAVQLATTGQKGLVEPDGTTITITAGVITAATATSSTLGIVKPDNTTITISAGVISAALPVGANPTATASDVAVNGSATTFMRSDAAPAVQLGSNSQKGLVQVDGTTITASGGVISTPGGANPTATGSNTAVNGSASTFMRSDGAPAIQKTSSSVFGLAKVDNTTITASGGIITATGSGLLPSPGAYHPGYVTNRQYPPPGTYGTITSFTMTTGQLYTMPFYCGVSHTFTGMGISVQTNVAGSHVELGVYANNSGVPGALIIDAGEIDSSIVGNETITGLSIPLTPGWYWLACSSSNSSVVVKGLANSSFPDKYMSGFTGALNSFSTTPMSVAWVFSTGNLPNPFGTLSYGSTGLTPIPYLIA